MSRMSAIATLTARQTVNVALRKMKDGTLVFLFAGDQSPKALCIWEKLEQLANDRPEKILLYRTLPLNRVINNPEADDEEVDEEEDEDETINGSDAWSMAAGVPATGRKSPII